MGTVARRGSPSPSATADQVVLLVLDGLGWEQLVEHAALMPTLASMTGGPITTVAPTTTATALSSIATGLTPAEHGLVGYRMMLGGEVLNVLRWNAAGDARRRSPRRARCSRSPPSSATPCRSSRRPSFGARRSPRPTCAGRAGRLAGAVGDRRRGPPPARAGERFVYAYYGGVDKTAHERGFGEFYDAELRLADRLVADVLDVLPPGRVLLVTADHGQVEVGDHVIVPDPSLLAMVAMQSGEGRFRWWHADRGAGDDLLAKAATERYGDVAWVVTQEQVIDEHWFGPTMAGRWRPGSATSPSSPTSR